MGQLRAAQQAIGRAEAGVQAQVSQLRVSPSLAISLGMSPDTSRVRELRQASHWINEVSSMSYGVCPLFTIQSSPLL